LGRFEVNDIDPNICTHIIYTFFGVTADGGVKYLDPFLDLTDNYGKGLIRLIVTQIFMNFPLFPTGYIQKFINLKKINPNVKLMAAFGGWNAGSEVFSSMASNDYSRYNFAVNAASFLAKWGFDGELKSLYLLQLSSKIHLPRH
jgi:chitinase